MASPRSSSLSDSVNSILFPEQSGTSYSYRQYEELSRIVFCLMFGSQQFPIITLVCHERYYIVWNKKGMHWSKQAENDVNHMALLGGWA